MEVKLNRFLEAQNQTYLKALSEIKNGRKESHWMWYIFPQVKGLGHSEMANYYGINSLYEATAYLEHPVLRKHLVEITTAVLNVKDKSAGDIFGSPDDLKLRSCMTLFANAKNTDTVFSDVLDKYFSGKEDVDTLDILNKSSNII